MKKEAYILVGTESPDQRVTDCPQFSTIFQRAILLSLLANNQLTQTQIEACMAKVVQKNAAHSHA